MELRDICRCELNEKVSVSDMTTIRPFALFVMGAVV